MQIGEEADGRTIEMTPGEAFAICLAENPTTGFTWNLISSGEPVCALVGDRYEPGSGGIGGVGRHCWDFRAERSGESRIALCYRRAWEQQSEGAKSFAIQVAVKE